MGALSTLEMGLPVRDGLADALRGPDRAHTQDGSIAMSVCVNADAERIFQALTVPEFLETWISLPDRSNDSVLHATQHTNGYQLDHCCAGRMPTRITGYFLFCHRRKMRLVWRKAHGARHHRSVVDFRIRGNFGSSVLKLRHMELGSAEETLWHHELWQRSLERLASLLRSAS
jgi:hypothetical protein